MKKVLALLLSATAACSVTSLNAMARETRLFPIPSASSSDASSAASSDVSSAASSSEASSAASSSETSSAASSSDTSAPEATSSNVTSSNTSSAVTPTGEPSSLVFGADSSGAILGETLLEPGTEYKFPVSVVYTEGGQITVPLTEAIMKNYKFSYNRLSGSGISTMKIQESRGIYYLYIEAKSGAPTKEVDVKYNIRMLKKATNLSAFTQEVKFSYGYSEANGDYLNNLDKDDVVEIDNNNPVVTKSQWTKIAKANDYKNVTISGPSWNFKVNVTDETTKNMVTNNAGIKDVLSALPDQEFKFFNFPGKPSFSATGLLSLDVDDITDDFDKMYTYRYSNGKLYRMNATFNAEDNTLEFRTNTLDNFVVTDKLVKDGTLIGNDSSSNTSSSSDTSSNSSNSGNTTPNKQNPGTGANDVINLAVMAAIASLGAAGTFAVKKGSKKK